VSISKEILTKVIEEYAKDEKGVRELKRGIQTVVSKINLLRFYNDPVKVPFAIKDFALPFTIKKDHVDLFLKKKAPADESIRHLYC
jgi:ATP-dependent Lon protease